MIARRFASACGRRRARVCAGLLLLACLILWLMPRAGGAQSPSSGSPARQTSQSRKADTGAREKIVEALEAFGELLAVSRSADAMGSHWQVRQQPWRDAQEAWERSSATLPPSVKGLRRCAVPLVAARGMIERADNLFRQARETSDPFGAARMLAQHERLLKRAEVSLRRAERCYLAVRRLHAASVLQD